MSKLTVGSFSMEKSIYHHIDYDHNNVAYLFQTQHAGGAHFILRLTLDDVKAGKASLSVYFLTPCCLDNYNVDTYTAYCVQCGQNFPSQGLYEKISLAQWKNGKFSPEESFVTAWETWEMTQGKDALDATFASVQAQDDVITLGTHAMEYVPDEYDAAFQPRPKIFT